MICIRCRSHSLSMRTVCCPPCAQHLHTSCSSPCGTFRASLIACALREPKLAPDRRCHGQSQRLATHLHTASWSRRHAVVRAAADAAVQTHTPDTPPEVQAQSSKVKDEQLSKDVDKPQWHIGPPRGWVNDPNAPLLYNGTYHLFFQHLPDKTEWEFGITWGHVASTDLVHWTWLPVALEPTPGGFDADGCFSGSALLDKDGTPTIVYTEEHDLGLPFVEAQLCAAHADPASDPLLKVWTKDAETASIQLPPPELAPANTLMGWRDPFIFEQPDADNNCEYGMLLGSGIKDKGGCVLVYRSKELTSGWRYVGTLCQGSKDDSGFNWECPILLPLKPDPNSSDGQPAAIVGSLDHCHAGEYTHVLFVSPDAPSQPVLYWLGVCKDAKFNIEEATGPLRLDLGDSPYAPNTLVNDDGRHLMWVWIQEHPSRTDDNFNYSGCMSAPRELHIRDGRLVQRPLQELDMLHGAHIFSQAEEVALQHGRLWEMPGASTTSMDATFTLHPGSAEASGLAVLDCRGADGPRSAAIVYHWDTDRLEVAYNVYLVQSDRSSFSVAAEGESEDAGAEEDRGKPRRVGGKLGWCKEHPLRVRALFDGSCIEVFAGLSHDDVARGVLSTRIYRGRSTNPGLAFFAVGGTSSVSQIDVHEMQQCWTDLDEVERLASKPCTKCDKPTRPAEKAIDMPYGEVTAGRCKQCLGLHRPGECPLEADGNTVVHPHGEGNA